MPAPTSQDIRRKALELYYATPAYVGLPPPEDVELKDRNLWREAQTELMRTWGVEIGGAIRKGVETPPLATKEYLDYLKGELDRLEAMIREVKATPRRRRVSERIRTMKIMEEVAGKEEALTLLLEREPLLERAYAGDPLVLSWLETRGITLEDFEAEVEYLRSVVADPPQELIPPMTLRNHTIENITALTAYIQSEGWMHYIYWKRARVWTPVVGMAMGIIEPIEYTGRLVSRRASRWRVDALKYGWRHTHHRAISLLKRIEPHLMGDKREVARYMLNIAERYMVTIPDTEYRPLYYTYPPLRPVFLYPQYTDFPVEYAIVAKKGEYLPRPVTRILALKYTPQGTPILWTPQAVYQPSDGPS